jgi:hypothetical protein
MIYLSCTGLSVDIFPFLRLCFSGGGGGSGCFFFGGGSTSQNLNDSLEFLRNFRFCFSIPSFLHFIACQTYG